MFCNPDMKCDVCGTKENLAGVASSTTGAISFCFCVPCLQMHAEPEWTFEYLYSDVGHNGDGLADWVTELMTYKDGEYWSWDRWKAWRKDNIPEYIKKMNDEEDRERDGE